jgi:hypothetical protein
MVIVLAVAPCRVKICFLERLRYLTDVPIADSYFVNARNGGDLASGASEEELIGGIEF